MKINHIILIVLAITFFSCEQIKNKGKELADKTKENSKSKTLDVLDKAFPIFDSDKSDTKYNKIRFKEYLEVNPSSDVNDIYCYGDFIGADYKVLFSFSCDTNTINKIVEKKRMKYTNESDDNGLQFEYDFPWWNKEQIKLIRAYKVGEDYKYWKYLWYDKENERAYYQEFSL